METADWLLDWFAARGEAGALTVEENYYDKGVIDSFSVIELIEDVETRFGIRFSDGDFRDKRFPTVAGLADLIAEKQRVDG